PPTHRRARRARRARGRHRGLRCRAAPPGNRRRCRLPPRAVPWSRSRALPWVPLTCPTPLLCRKFYESERFEGGFPPPFFFARCLLIGCCRLGASAFAFSASSSRRCCSASYLAIGTTLPLASIALPLRAKRSSRCLAASEPGV